MLRRALLLLCVASCGDGDPGVDADPPDTTLTEGPAEVTAATTATFRFTSSARPARFECRLDGASFTVCDPPVSVSVGEGVHRFEVRAIGDATPAALAWRVDLTPPETSIASGPEATMAMSEATFEFASSEAGSSFLCSLDGAAPASCASPLLVSALAAGAHTFAVTAADPAVNGDPTPATWSWTVVAITPETTIVRAPFTPWREETVEIEFTADVPDCTFECRLDDGPRERCSSPHRWSGVAEGYHELFVWATDPHGATDPSPAVAGFAIQFSYW